YKQFRDKVLRVAAGLKKRGIKSGDFVLVHLDNCPELEFLWFATARLGAIIVTTNTRSAGPELEYFAEHCGAVAAITQPELAELVAKHAKNIKWLVVTEHTVDGAPTEGALKPSKDMAFSTLDGDPSDLPTLEADPWRPGSVQYTSAPALDAPPRCARPTARCRGSTTRPWAGWWCPMCIKGWCRATSITR